jgi:carbon starvation protein
MVGGKLPFFRNRWIATFAVIIPAYFMGANGAFQIIWPVFGSANQLVAALVLLVITAFLVKTRKPSLYAMLPAAFMLVTTIGSLLWQFKVFMFSDNPKPGLGLTTILLLLLAGYVTFESVKELKNRSLPEKK